MTNNKKPERKTKNEIIESLLEEIESIDSNDSLSRSQKTKKFGRLAATVLHQLKGGMPGQALKDDDAVEETTFIRYVTEARRSVIKQNWKHHHLTENIEKLVKKYPEYKKQFNKIKRFKVENGLIYIKNLKTELKEGSQEAYEDLSGLQIGHEILNHLSITAEIKRRNLQYKDKVTDKHNKPLIINYHYIKWLINDLLTRKTKKVNGVECYAYTRLALGIALATGRRAIEVLAPWQGHVTPHGEHTIHFSGAAKKRGKEVARGVIYTVVPAQLVMSALWHLRRLPEIAALKSFKDDHDRNTKVNLRTVKALNEQAKLVFNSQEMVFKDSRNIYGKMVLHEHYKQWHEQNGGTETAFLKAMFMHENIETQLIYNAILLDFDESELKFTESAQQTLASKRIGVLGQFDDHEGLKNKSMKELHELVKSKIKESPDVKINQTYLNKKLGVWREKVKRYLTIIGTEVNVVLEE